MKASTEIAGPHSKHRRRAPYGQQWKTLHSEAYKMWLSADDEPEETSAFGMLSLLVLDDEEDKASLMSAKIWAVVDDLPRSQRNVLRSRFLLGLNYKEVSQQMLVSSERIRQLEAKALQTLRFRLLWVWPNVRVTSLTGSLN